MRAINPVTRVGIYLPVKPDRQHLMAGCLASRVSVISISRAIVEAVDILLRLSRDSWLGQRNDRTLSVQVSDCLVNGTIEFGNSCEGLMS